MKEKIVFFGSGPYVRTIVASLSEAFDIPLVVTTEIKPNLPEGLNFISVSKFTPETIEKIKSLNCNVAVLASFGIIVPGEVLNLFRLGIINIHPSLLPLYRGPTPGQTALLNGDKKTGVSIMKLDSEIDHGPILVQEEAKIESNDTSDSLYKKLFQQGAQLLVRTLPNYLNGELAPFEQDHSKATSTEHLSRESGFIDINDERRTTSEELDAMIRAYYPWPGVWFKTKLNGVVRIVKLLPEQKIQVEGKNVMALSDFLNGYPEGENIIRQLGL